MKKLRNGLLALLALLVVAFGAFVWWLQPPAIEDEMLFTGGTIITMEPDQPQVEALLVRDGRIAALGDLASVEAQASNSAVRHDLAGDTLMPGLIEPHAHPLTTAVFGTTVDLSGFTHANREEVIASLRAAVAERSGTILATGWDPVMLDDLDDLDAPTLAELDEIAPDQPLMILTQMMHDAYANSLALEAAGITRDTPNPQGGEFLKDENGELTGTVREVSALAMLLSAIPPAPEGGAEFVMAGQWGAYARAGYTTVAAMGVTAPGEEALRQYQEASRIERSPVRTLAYGLPQQLDAGDSPDDPTRQAGVIGVKFWIDGSPFAGGAAFEEPYENTELVLGRLHLDEDHLAPLNYDIDVLSQLFADYHSRGYQIAVHVQGERAIEMALQAAERAFGDDLAGDHRMRLEHNALISADQLARAREMGITTSFFVDHIFFYGHALNDLVGEERVARYMPLKTALEAGHRITIHTDNPATPVDPFRAMRTARERAARNGGMVLAPDQRLTPMEALRAMTIDAAWQLQLEDETGSLAVGKSADLVQLSANPLEISDAELSDINVRATWLAGAPADYRALNWTTFRLGINALWHSWF